MLVVELTAHRAAVAAWLNAPEPDASLERIAPLKTGFHRAKGGAGFFGLQELAQVASEAEELLAKPPAEIRASLERIAALFEQFDAALGRLAVQEAEHDGGEHA